MGGRAEVDLLIGLWEYLHLSAHRGATRWLLGEAEVPSHLPVLPSPFTARVRYPSQPLADAETDAAPTKGA